MKGKHLIPVLIAIIVLPAAVLAISHARADEINAPGKIRVLYLPVMGNTETVKRWQPLTDHLNRALGGNVTAYSCDTYKEVLLALARGEFEIAYLGPAIFFQAEEVSRIKVLAMELDETGREGYYSIIICRADSPMQTLEDGRGKVLAFTNESSTSGFIVPVHHFLNGLRVIPASFASRVVFAGNHHAVIAGVHNREFDLGATGSIDLDRTAPVLKINPEHLRILWQSELIPGAPICARGNLSPELMAKIQAALVSFPKDTAVKKIGIGGFIAADEKAYDSLRKYFSKK